MSPSALKPQFLRVEGTDIVNSDGERVILKGVATGGHLNMENFITGYPGHEHELRAAMLEVLGQEKYDFFFDKFLEYFFTSSDAKFLKSLGMNCLRIPINHRHFMDDRNPGVIKASGFKLVDRIVDACAAEGIYTVLDLHTCPGGQNQGWHSDSGIHKALFWEFKDFQDRVIQLWTALAKHYANNTWIAGYNPMNEPGDPKHSDLQKFYTRVEKAIREVDPNHMLFLDGNTYAMDFSGFENVLPNTVYAIHDYSNMGFPMGDAYKGTSAQKKILQKQFDRKIDFMREHKVPVWNGEFGPVYASPEDGKNFEEINQQRYDLLGQQLSIYRKENVSWSIWTYKDIGFQGMVYTDPNSPYIRLLKPILEKKKRMGLDKWGRDDKFVADIYEPVMKHLEAEIPDHLHKIRYPHHWGLRVHAHRVLREMLVSEYLVQEFAEYFGDKSFDELDELAASFKLENCVKRDGLNKILEADAEMTK
ncbi:endo-1,4-beta-glucanase [Saitoella coloradoensis]